VQLARTEAEKQRGLMGVTSLTNEEGMLFIWDEENIYPFWMKDTLLPLDIIWIGTNGTIVEAVTAFPCEGDPCTVYTPRGNSQYVLEINAGLMRQWGVRIGDNVTILMNPNSSQK
jgi:uncharacterized membrane protein (UPF0127 family)